MAAYEKLTGEGEYICYCAHVTEDEMLRALDNGAKNENDVIAATGAMPKDCNCLVNNPKKRCCYKDIAEVVRRYKAAHASEDNK